MAEQMKESGIQWIGAIPYNWNVERIKHIIQNNDNGIKVGPFGSALTNEVVSSDEGKYKVYGQSNLIRKDFSYGDNYVSEQNYKRLINYEVLPNDIAVSMMGTIGKCSVVPDNIEPGIMDSHLIKIRLSQKMLPRYFEYAYESDMGYNQLLINSKGSIMNGLNSTIVKGLYIPVPGIVEQQAIVDFLDKECAQIDSIATDLEKQIELLQQYKKSLITETVTKGLDKSVPMKDSGVEWIGKIPAHWDFKRLKFMLENSSDSMKVGPFGSALSGSDFTDEGKWVYNQRVVLDNNFSENTTFVSEEKFQEMQSFAVYPGDILITTRGTIGKVAIVPEWANEGILHPCIIKFRIDKEMIIPELLQLIFNESDFVKDQFTLMSNATTIEVIYSYSLKDILLPVIPADEQEKIYAYLSKKCIAIDGIIAEKQKALATITQHKKSLIYEYVTGKKRVKEVQ